VKKGVKSSAPPFDIKELIIEAADALAGRFNPVKP
jgi:hypothetical protein